MSRDNGPKSWRQESRESMGTEFHLAATELTIVNAGYPGVHRQAGNIYHQ